jgi:SNF2 family DNA or RNA helicase
MLQSIKQKLGIPLEPFAKKKLTNGDQAEPLFQDPIEFSEDACFIESIEEQKRRKRIKAEVKKSKRIKPVILDENVKLSKCEDSTSANEESAEEIAPIEDVKPLDSKPLEEMKPIVEESEEEEEEKSEQNVDDIEVPTSSFLLPPPTNDQTREFKPSSKLKHLMKILNSIRQNDPEGKIVIFSQFTTMLDMIECMLLLEGYKVAR